MIDDDAARIAEVLIRRADGELFDAVQYSLREILRNAAEHSRSGSASYCAQFWPAKDRVEISILDAGIGIRDSLSKNPHLEIDTDEDAIKLALMPGISGKMYEGVEVRPYDEWQNSGYGLYLISRLCRSAGSFFICSNTSGLGLIAQRHIPVSGKLLRGTSVRLKLDTTKLAGLSDRLRQFAAEGQVVATQCKGGGKINASAASLMLNSQREPRS